MGYRLYREIRDFAPQDWTSGEMLVALMIADDARDDGRISWIAPCELARRCRMGDRAIRKTLEKLAGKGYEFRVGHGKGKDGREVYATKDHPIEYVVPDIVAISVARAGACGQPPARRNHSTALARLSTGRRRNHSSAKAVPRFRLGSTRTISF